MNITILKMIVVIGDIALLISSSSWIIYTLKLQEVPELLFNFFYTLSAIIISVLNLYLILSKDGDRNE